MFTIRIDGDKAVIAELDEMPGRVHDALRATIQSLVIKLMAIVQREKLQGQVLRHVTGKLSASIEEEVTENPQGIVGRVFSNGTAPYAAIHEFGYQGAEAVSSFTRMQTMAFGRPMNPPKEVVVGAFVRQMNMPERSFLRSTLTEQAEFIEKSITDAVVAAALGGTA
jgi:phage gpG-like protein